MIIPSLTLRLIAVLALITVGCSQRAPEEGPSGAPHTGASGGLSSLRGTPERAGYPTAWEVDSLSAATAQVNFDLVMANYGPLSEQTIRAIFVFPTGAVAIDYEPPVKEPREYVRQEYIEVYQAPWTELDDPTDVYANDLAKAPDPAKSLVDVAGASALVVEPHSQNDDDRANPAFVRFVVDGIEVQLSGGEDLELLIAVAESMVASR
ncbi:MAG: hypothetical protein WD096_02675 [Actinomycetota bacterium]